jgi:hypothetical protein
LKIEVAIGNWEFGDWRLGIGKRADRATRLRRAGGENCADLRIR